MKRLAALLLLLPCLAQAEGLQYVPKWRMVGGLACYDKGGAAQLLQVDARVGYCEEALRLRRLEVEALQGRHTALQTAFDAQTALAQAWEAKARENEAQRTQTRQALTRCEAKQAGTGFGWYVAGALVLVLGGAAAGVALSR